jgi:hypothetical protein
MGAWGAKAFENDAALDWLAELEVRGVLALRAVLSGVAELERDEYLDQEEGSTAIAAAEVVAAALGRGRDRVHPEANAWLDANAGEIVAEDLDPARRAVERVLAENSELRDLWDENGPHAAWHADVGALLLRLGGDPDGMAPPTRRSGGRARRNESARARMQLEQMKMGLLVLFRARHLEPTEEQVERISASNDEAEVREWVARAIEGASIEEILSDGKA